METEPSNSTRQRLGLVIRIGLSLGLLYCIYLVSTRAIGLWYFRYQAPPGGIKKAIQWDPKNPEYYDALGRFYERALVEADLEESIRNYEKATALSPHRAGYWADLGGAYELAGRLKEAEAAYKRARELFPNSPCINWQLGNFLVRTGRIEEALPAFQKTILGDPELRPAAFDLTWRAGAEPTLILDKMIPADTSTLFQYLNYLAQTQRLDAAAQVWDRLLALGQPFNLQMAFPYLDALIRDQRVEELTAAWAALEERYPTQIRKRAYDPNLITNGDFESEILNGGLGWRVRPVEGVVVSVDNLTFFDGTRSLRLAFDGKHNVDYRYVFHYIPVKPNSLYRFMGYMRVQELTTDSGLHFEVQDAYDRGRLHLETENLVGTSSWSPQQLEFKTGPETQLLLLRIARSPSQKFDNQIAGTAWVDRVSLNAVE